MLKRLAARGARAILRAVESRASLENPSTPLDGADADDDWFDGVLGGQTKSAAGVKVNRDTALRYSPIWRGVNLIARDVAKLPCVIYRRDGAGKQKATDHPAFSLLRRKPNREMTSFVFKSLLISLAVLEGNGIAYIERAGDGTPLELIPLGPGKCFAVRDAGVLMYVVDVNGVPRKVLPDNIFHVKGPSSDGLMGDRLYDRARESIGLGTATRNYGARFFKNNARPSVTLETPNKLSDQAAKRLLDSWNAMHSGIDNAHRAALLEEGLKITPFSINAVDSQLLETRKFEIVEVANWIGVPPHKLGDSSRTAYNSLEQENQSYLDGSLDPWLVAYEEEAFDKLLTEDEKRADSHTIEFLRQALLRADMATRGEFYNKATGGLPWMTANEVRGRENLNPIDGFDTIKIPTNNFGPPKPAKEKQSKAARAVLADAARRMAKRLSVHARKASQRSVEDLAGWLDDDMRREHLSTITEAMAPVVAVLAVVGRSIDADAAAERFIKTAGVVLQRSAGLLGSDAGNDALVNTIVAAAMTELLGD